MSHRPRTSAPVLASWSGVAPIRQPVSSAQIFKNMRAWS